MLYKLRRLFSLLLLARICTVSALPFNINHIICTRTIRIPHTGVPDPYQQTKQYNVPITLYIQCVHLFFTNLPPRPLLIVQNGALVRSKDYTSLAIDLARRGFLVVVPNYDQRPFIFSFPIYSPLIKFINKTIADGFDCPRSGTFTSVRLCQSILRWFLNDHRHNHITQRANLKQVVLFGHSFGGIASALAISNRCKDFETMPTKTIPETEIILRVLCERYNGKAETVNVVGVFTWEGFSPMQPIIVPKEKFYVGMYSQFYEKNVRPTFRKVKGDGSVVLFKLKNSNHYGPNNYNSKNSNQKPVCSRIRPPPEDKFITTMKTQNKVIRTIGSVVEQSYKMFQLEGNKSKLLQLGKEDDIAQVKFLSGV